jgi:hypothetical protein
MAVTLGFGVVFATVITLVLVPAACMGGVEAARFARTLTWGAAAPSPPGEREPDLAWGKLG